MKNRTRRCGLARAGWALLCGLLGANSAQAAVLTDAETAWLRQNEPIVFVSQTVYPPFEFVDRDGQRQGMCIDLARWVAQELNFQAEFLDMPFQQAQDAVLSGEADVLTSLFYSPDRDTRFDFSDMTWEVPSLIFVRTERPDIARLKDLRSKRIAMQRGDYAADFLRAQQIDYQRVHTESFSEAADRVVAGDADAMVGDAPIVLYHLFSRGLVDEMKSVGEPLYIGRNAMAASEGRTELVAILNKGMALAREQGVFDAITAKWLGTRYGEATPQGRGVPMVAFVIGLLAALAMAAVLLGWIFHLRRIVVQRTAELREASDPHKPIARSRPWHLLGLRTLVLLGFLLPLGYAANYILHHHIIMPDFLAMEQREAHRKLNNAMAAIGREKLHLAKTARDWAFWDDTYRFALDLNEDYQHNNLVWPTLSEQTEIDAIAILALNGEVRWHGAYDPFREVPLGLDLYARGALSLDHPLLNATEAETTVSGIVMTEIGPMLVAACPILASDLSGPAHGIFVMGRYIREEVLDTLAGNLGVEEARMAIAGAPDLSPQEVEVFAHVPPGTFQTEETSATLLTGRVLLGDVTGQPALLLSLRIPRDLVIQGRGIARLLSFLLLEFVGIILVGTAIWFVFSFREAFRRQAHVEDLVETRTRALRSSEEKWKNYVESAPMGIFITDGSGRFREANPAGCRMIGYEEHELVARRVFDVVFPDDLEVAHTHFRQIMEQGHAIGEFRFLRKDHEVRYWSVSVVKLGNGDTLGFTEDITDRRQIEEARESLQHQLNQAQKMESIGRLAGGVAHDFNNMLGVILGFTELGLEAVEPTDALHGNLLEIRKAAERSADLTRQLLAFARKQTVVPRVLDLGQTVEGLLSMLRRIIGEHIVLGWAPAAEPIWVKMDPSQIDQILVNLCVNARDAIRHSGRIDIETGTELFDEETCAARPGTVLGEYACLVVRDTGCGMDAETSAHIFEPFFSTKEDQGGIGLGLATVYGIVKQNHGFIQVQSEPGHGTSFTLFLPRHDEDAPPPPSPDRQAPRKGSATILLVEDEPAHLHMTRTMLERHGYVVLAAHSPYEAMELARTESGRIDLLLTDVVMPQMNGRDLARRLLSIKPNLKRLFMSGYTADVIAHHGVVNAGVKFIQKPFTIRDLLGKVQEVLSHAQETD